MTGRKPATITDLFAKRSAEESVDRSWPSFGVGSTPIGSDDDAEQDTEGIFGEEDGDADVGADTSAPDTSTSPAISTPDSSLSDPSQSDTASNGSDEDDAGQVDELAGTETTDLPASADFAYSGALEAPVFDWPSAPVGDSEATETSDGGMVAATTTAVIVDSPDADRAEDTDRAEDLDRTDLVPGTDEPATVDASSVDESGSLPSPFLAPAGTSAVEYADAPLAPIIDLRHAAGSSGADIDEAISSGEVEVVAALIEQGMLSTDGPISDRDVRTMVYVAFTSNELRKLLAAGGSPDSPNPGIDLGPVELFKDGMVQPPKTLYPGPPVETEARSQLG